MLYGSTGSPRRPARPGKATAGRPRTLEAEVPPGSRNRQLILVELGARECGQLSLYDRPDLGHRAGRQVLRPRDRSDRPAGRLARDQDPGPRIAAGLTSAAVITAMFGLGVWSLDAMYAAFGIPLSG